VIVSVLSDYVNRSILHNDWLDHPPQRRSLKNAFLKNRKSRLDGVEVMFAVKGWNLGQVVTETAQKKKLKRKRNDKEESGDQTNATSIKGLRNNPFAIRQTQPPKPPVKSDPPNRHKNPAIDNRSNRDVSELRNADAGSESSVKRAEKALKKAKKRHQRKLKSAANVIETPSV
jgi:hypothetical protein